MRQILFRGKRIDNGEWVYGGFYKEPYSERCLIISWNSFGFGFNEEIKVIPETVGQYTGLKDKNRKQIFEGDIVKGRHWTDKMYTDSSVYHLFRVDWSKKSGLITFVDSPTFTGSLSIHDFADFDEVEVVGNTYDRPDLLKVIE